MSSFTTPRAPIAPLSRVRVRAALAVIAVSAALILGSALAAWNPWHFVVFGFGGYWFAGVLTLAPLAGGAVAVLLIRNKAAAITVGVVSAVLTLIVAVGGFLLALLVDPHWDRTVLAASPSGRFQLVSLEESDIIFRQQLRVGRPDGILTRESARPLICVEATFGDTPEIRVKSARFVAEHEVEITFEDGKTWRTRFDPDDLQPADVLTENCSL
ncbi:hypothetical protein [Dactylosporangium sp. NPDC050588]|uniref:hypothetical protein n=1 Tax=Dactylosporangium sp. NPDC050588 TaxID=3157211 RepID=UPI0033FAC984